MHSPESQHPLIRTLRYAVPLAVVLAGCTGNSDESGPNLTATVPVATSGAEGVVPDNGSVGVNPAGISLEFDPDPRAEGGVLAVTSCDGVTDTSRNGVYLPDLDPTDTDPTVWTLGAVDQDTYDATPPNTMTPARIGASIMGIGNYSYAFAVSSEPGTVRTVDLQSHPTANGKFQAFTMVVPGGPADNFNVSISMQLSPDRDKAQFSVGCVPYTGPQQAPHPTYEA